MARAYYITTDSGERRKIGAKERWTRRCEDGCACKYVGAENTAYVADDQSVCNACLLARYELDKETTYDGCSDPLSMVPLVPRDAVVHALRRARAGK